MYLIGFPLLLIPFAIYNMIAFLFRDRLQRHAVFDPDAVEGDAQCHHRATSSIILSIFLLFIEILKSTRVGTRSIIDHVLSFVLFIVMAGEFMIVPWAATSTFLLMLVICFVDVVGGFSVSIRTAQRDIDVERSGSGDPLLSGRSESPHDPRLPSPRPFARLCPRRHGRDLASAGEPRGDRNPARGRQCRRRRGHGGCALLSVIEPQMTGIGGDCFCLVAKPGAPVWGYNGSGRTGAAMDLEKLHAEGLKGTIPQGFYPCHHGARRGRCLGNDPESARPFWSGPRARARDPHGGRRLRDPAAHRARLVARRRELAKR